MTVPRAVVAALLLCVLSSSASVAQSPVVAQWKTYVLESCGKEMKRFCNNVVAGDGRILACLYARDKSLSGTCRTAIASARERLARSYAAAVEAQRVCEPDARRLCAGMVPGGGNLTDCLALARTRVSRACNAVLDEALLRP